MNVGTSMVTVAYEIDKVVSVNRFDRLSQSFRIVGSPIIHAQVLSIADIVSFPSSAFFGAPLVASLRI